MAPSPSAVKRRQRDGRGVAIVRRAEEDAPAVGGVVLLDGERLEVVERGVEQILERFASDESTRKRRSSAGYSAKDVLDALEERLLAVVCRRRPASRRGSVLPSSSSRCFCSFVSFFGTATRAITWRSPWPRPDTFGMPLPRSLKRAPGCVPAGTCSSSRPSSVGTLIVPPSASVGKLIGISQYRSSPSRWKNECSCTWTTT